MVSARPVGTGIAAWIEPGGGGPGVSSTVCVVPRAHSSESARVSTLSPSGWCTTTVVPLTTGTRNVDRLRSWTFSTWLSGGSRSPKPPPPPPCAGTSTVMATAAATQPRMTSQRPVVTATR